MITFFPSKGLLTTSYLSQAKTCTPEDLCVILSQRSVPPERQFRVVVKIKALEARDPPRQHRTAWSFGQLLSSLLRHDRWACLTELRIRRANACSVQYTPRQEALNKWHLLFLLNFPSSTNYRFTTPILHGGRSQSIPTKAFLVRHTNVVTNLIYK